MSWVGVFFSALWMVGLAVLLFTLSMTHWLATMQQSSLRQSMSESPFRQILIAGLMLFGVGLIIVFLL